MFSFPTHSQILGMPFFHSLSIPFLGILGNDSLSFPFPNCGNGFFSFPSRSQILGIDVFIPFPFPNFGNAFFHSLPVPEFREWFFSIPFQFPNNGNGIIHSRSRSQTPKCHSCSPLVSQWVSDKGCQRSDSGPIKRTKWIHHIDHVTCEGWCNEKKCKAF